jgi:MFS family permease
MAGAEILRAANRVVPVSDDAPVPPLGLKWRSTTSFIIATIATGMFTDLFLYGLVVPVFPFMLRDRVGIPESRLQHVIDAMLSIYAIASTVSSPIVGFLTDRFSNTRQFPFLLGLTVLIMATVMLAVGRSIAVLAVARFLQGASSGIVWTVGLTMTLEAVGAKNLGKVIGTLFSLLTCGTIWSPVVGGLLYEKTGSV